MNSNVCGETWTGSVKALPGASSGISLRPNAAAADVASEADVQRVFLPAMRHRVLLNFEGEAEGIGTDAVLRDILERTPTTMDSVAS